MDVFFISALFFRSCADELDHDSGTLSCWYRRALAANGLWDEMVRDALNEPGHAGTNLRKERLVSEIFADRGSVSWIRRISSLTASNTGLIRK